jgi:hypothetical protein
VSVLRWEDPPPAKGHRPFLLAHDLIAHQLRNRPGSWAVVAESPSQASLANYIAEGRYRAYAPAGTFEAVSRHVGGIPTIYARYVGEVTP